MSNDGLGQVEYFYNTRTRMVEKGRLSSWEDLMGPYSTREEAEQALETAKKRSASWDEDDAEWKGER
ncbi:SPOR domain-containing protein [Demequina zhanjiangensis]|uniref:SPOR domain-containing protein n=1 Tax=Demequina zhanjiangensis TaxID=3051659 RepID=A0ABT8G0F2_9MICO|nr:SPOR domain-containing protein [Demequina sp. SYSU T00b26]MDN4472615.1 SPOR domain-containing protein [Demequina sp. SYSU T00b26]